MNTLVYLDIFSFFYIFFNVLLRNEMWKMRYEISSFSFLILILMVEIKGVEPLTSCLQGRRSSQLSYIPM